MKLIFALIVFIGCFQTYAQLDSATLRRKYEKEVIHFSGNKYVKNNVAYKLKFLKMEFQNSPQGLQVYLLSRQDFRKQRLLAIVGLTSFASGLIAIEHKQYSVGSSLFLGSIVPNIISLRFGFRSINKMHKAVWLRNRDVLLQSQ